MSTFQIFVAGFDTGILVAIALVESFKHDTPKWLWR